MDTKPWFKSWIIWFKIAVAVLTAAASIAHLVPSWAGVAGSLDAIIVIVLRLNSTQIIQ